MDFSQFARKRTKDDSNKKKLEFIEVNNSKSSESLMNKNQSVEFNKQQSEGEDFNESAAAGAAAAGTAAESIVSETITKDIKSIEEVALEYGIPIINQVDLKGHQKAVSCISFEPAGNRLITGSLDYHLKLYDFGGMDSRQQAFHSFEPDENHFISSISHSPSGDKFVICTGSAQPIVYDRHGKELIIKFVKGDMYLHDLSNTKGHTMDVTDCCWHPIEKNIILTSSADGSLRIWDLLGQARFGNLVNKHVLKIRGGAGKVRTGAKCCTFSPSGARIAGGVSDGTIHIWQTSRLTYGTPDMILKPPNGSHWGEVLRILIGKDNQTLAARYDQGYVALWNISNISTSKTPLKVFSGLPNEYFSANIDFNPDMSILCCGTSPMNQNNNLINTTTSRHSSNSSNSSSSNSSSSSSSNTADDIRKSRLFFFPVSTESTSPLLNIAIAENISVICVRWQPLTNQIICGLSNGDIRILYDTSLSKKGVLLSVTRAPKRLKDPTDFAVIGEIYAPLALKMFRTDRRDEVEKKKRMQLKDPTIAKIPTKPITSGPGSRPNNSFFYTNYVMQHRDIDNSRLEDPREALLRVAKEAEQDPKYTGRAYEKTEPKKVLYSQTFEEEEGEFKKRQKTL